MEEEEEMSFLRFELVAAFVTREIGAPNFFLLPFICESNIIDFVVKGVGVGDSACSSLEPFPPLADGGRPHPLGGSTEPLSCNALVL